MSGETRSFLSRLLKPSSIFVLLGELVVVFVLGFAFSQFWGGSDAPSAEASAEHDHAAERGPQLWTCSMHPQIKANKPGKCPICAMELIPLSTNTGPVTGLRQLVVSTAARALMNIQVTPVQRRYVEANVRMVGKVDYDETRLKRITARVAGRLDRLFVDYTGVQVNEGDHMVYIYSEQLYTAQQELIETARVRKAQADAAGADFFATGGIDLLESAREKLRLLGLTQEQIAEIETREKPTDNVMIYAPMGGIVIEKLKQEGDRVNTGDRIYTVADLSQLWVQMDAYESDLIWLRYGQSVTFTTEAYPGQEFRGRIAFIDPVLNDKTRTVKIRVNVDNTEGKLKPDMFVRAIVQAKVAAGGRVIDADLEGKWISPMHPEIVKDEPGDCDICGMPLVRAESLGYVSSKAMENTQPLVIPVSAALVTGTRAIVYVEDPKAKEPTFEGREVVLGPRAGDHYLVRSGLKEGELVVTNGNFKIDSALQIVAKPSMMTPEGGGGHQHGDNASSGTPPKLKDLPISIRQRLIEINTTWQHIQNAAEEENLDAVQQHFGKLKEVVQSVDSSLLAEHPKMLWSELSMLIGNDATEGQTVKTIKSAQQLVGELRRDMQRLDEQFGLAHAESLPQKLVVPAPFQQQLSSLWDAYQKMGDALASDNFPEAQKAVQQFEQSMKSADMKLLTDNKAHRAWMKEQKNLAAIVESLKKTEEIRAFRAQFEPLSAVLQVLAMSFGFGETEPVFLLHCPMAFNNKGAIWLQDNSQTRNPYFGSTMLQCADRTELIAGEKPDAAEAISKDEE
ncbi:efflux RND transporter periplasmic adaptor subunit [Thalassoglobus polymorphus]|uniref:Cation efflux system protein CusB n=1 Tax=Thalassoglobus polymorphus TaxID=2527994 RepID=A0A517QKS2_9PLAN|nr:efflux RND transporter periplasmic adaptor subunit [Thalassoglobus polymorphus]QDT32233.1 Cation efflux system protein CusB precursor [Thalassoglobus polymorphus]